MKMICLSNIPINKTILLASSKNDSSASPNNPPPHIPSSSSSSNTRKLGPRRPPKPSVIQIERIVGAGSFRDGEPIGHASSSCSSSFNYYSLIMIDSDVRKSVFDLFLGKTFEGPLEKKMRTTGEWLLTNAEPRLKSSSKGILIFVFQLMLPIWAMSLLVASGIIKLPVSSPFLDDLLM
ncbi:hypothetical protein PIB30_023211 [Stylosanthes scabra]|uniref:NAD(P)H dehydrogenase subunit CRR3, chloroplastic n=1 Tax=Stylosanthes scabra TaxID=79078 RepID=A0ABU6V8X6_9FABA|nr:hypothetical protein [Stylosanthes scabra]